MRKREVMYMAITPDKLQLPMVVCDSLKQIAHWAGHSEGEIIDFIKTKKVDKINHCRYLKMVFRLHYFRANIYTSQNDPKNDR